MGSNYNLNLYRKRQSWKQVLKILLNKTHIIKLNTEIIDNDKKEICVFWMDTKILHCIIIDFVQRLLLFTLVLYRVVTKLGILEKLWTWQLSLKT